MNQSIEITDLGFSVADAEDIQFEFDGADLFLKFKDFSLKKAESFKGFLSKHRCFVCHLLHHLNIIDYPL
jgi:hypothetical protein